MSVPQKTSSTELGKSLSILSPIISRALFFGFLTNLLVLAPTVYMLQVYDRVVNSRSVETLMMLTMLVLSCYALMEFFDWARRSFLQAAGDRLDRELAPLVFSAAYRSEVDQFSSIDAAAAIKDLRTLKDFFSSPALIAMLDAPAAFLFLLLIFLIDSWLGVLALTVVLGQIVLAVIAQKVTQTQLGQAKKELVQANAYAASAMRNAEVAFAMGMKPVLHGLWISFQQNYLRLQAEASLRASVPAASSRLLQILQGSLILSLGVWLMLGGDFSGSAGLMLATTIIAARAVSPLTQLVGASKTIIATRAVYDRLGRLLASGPTNNTQMSLPPPSGRVDVETVSIVLPGASSPALKQISFQLEPGTSLGIIGPSSSGKSTLARLLVGIWRPTTGCVRLDGVDVAKWNKSELGPHIGYLPQDVELFDGTLAENISRFGAQDQNLVLDAIRRAGLEAWLESLESGLDTLLGDEGEILSGGLRQRVALARAIYGRPRLVVLDEPNANLDLDGDRALSKTLAELKLEGCTTIVVTHRKDVLTSLDRLLVLKDGFLLKEGLRPEICTTLGIKLDTGT